jgi:hypothetical protein
LLSIFFGELFKSLALFKISSFSDILVCPFILLVLSKEPKFLILDEIQFNIFLFIDYSFGVISKKLLPNQRPQRLIPLLSS